MTYAADRRGETSPFLRRALVADAVISGAAGVLMLAGAVLVEDLLGVPAALMRIAGASLLPFAAAVAYLASRNRSSPAATWTVILINTLWAAGSIALLLSGWIAPTALGFAFIIAQALIVAGFGELQFVGMRRQRTAA
jgi:hypothetical protein